MKLDIESRPVGAVDFGGTHIRTAVVDLDGTIRGFNYTETLGHLGPQAVIERLGDSIQASIEGARAEAADLAAIGVAAPGPLDHEQGIVLAAPNIPGFENVNVSGPLQLRFGAPAFIGNDANLAVLAEHVYGAGKGVDNMIYITVSTGVGGGILVNGELLLGVAGNAGEVGHITVDVHGERHHCGNIGCVEMYASGTGMARCAQDLLKSIRGSSLSEVLNRTGTITGKDVVAAAAHRDPVAVEAMRRGVDALAAGVVSLAHIFDPELFVIGGGVANAGDLLFEPLGEAVFDRLMKGFDRNFRIVPWTLGENVGLLGSAVWARRRLSRMLKPA